ncbi:hypothetical protein NQ317_002132 [Molorchus minor]|uniref:ATP synthase F0 subunit 8 n=1 Tax=Molorchus minor TaxID=1323400 RepID=A0ABQ9JV80_9CUCU|nr:hypothetical protein NQ317_002132 [Molorchus minor]
MTLFLTRYVTLNRYIPIIIIIIIMIWIYILWLTAFLCVKKPESNNPIMSLGVENHNNYVIHKCILKNNKYARLFLF